MIPKQRMLQIHYIFTVNNQKRSQEISQLVYLPLSILFFLQMKIRIVLGEIY